MTKLKILYIGLIFTFILSFVLADFIAPYTTHYRNTDYTGVPPSRIHFWHQGKFSGPFIYEKSYSADEPELIQISFFTKGYEYKFLGFIQTNYHLFGVNNKKFMVALLGTDSFGRDVFSRLVLGGRVSLSIAMGAAFLSTFLALYLGMIAGLCGGFVDSILQTFIEIIKSIPRILILMILGNLLPIDVTLFWRGLGLVCILGSLGWLNWTKVIRTFAYELQQKEFVIAARTSGADTWDILKFHAGPQLRKYRVLSFVNTFPAMLISESTLSFLGLGIREPASSWGLMLMNMDSLSNIIHMPWLMSAAVTIILVTLLAYQTGQTIQKSDPL